MSTFPIAGVLASGASRLKALRFPGGTATCSFGTPVGAFQKTDPFSLATWLKTTDTGFVVVSGKIDATSFVVGDKGYFMGLFNGALILFLASDYQESPPGTPSTTDWLSATSAASLVNDGKWHHLVATYDGSVTHAGMKLYVDSSLKSATNTGGPLVGSTILTSQDFRVSGRLSRAGPIEAPVNGDVLGTAVYNKALSGAEIVTIYNKRVPPDLTAVGPTGNLVGYWPPRLADTSTTVTDLSTGSHNGTLASGASIVTRQ